RSGLTSTVQDQGNGMFGASRSAAAGGQLLNSWLAPGNLYLANYGNQAATFAGGLPALSCATGFQQSALLPLSTCDPNTITNIEFVGPKTPNPSKSVAPSDRNNFGPAVGFAWQVPWFGEGKTTVRGGYQVTYQGGDRSFGYDLAIGYTPGQVATPTITPTGSTYVTLNDLLKNFIPVPNTLSPMQTVPNTYRTTVAGWSAALYDPHYVAPYVQNFTLSLTRSVARNMTIDIRYIGTKGTKLFGSLPLNSRNFLTNGLKEAFDAARYGGESALLDKMFNGINIAGTGCNGVAG